MLNIFVTMHFAMKSITHSRPQLIEYKLVLEPGGNTILSIREEIKKEGLGGDCIEILLGSFHIKEEMEGTLVRWFQRIFNLQGTFQVTLNNFGAKPPHNIHLRIQEKDEIIKMICQLKMIDHFIQSNDCPPAVLSSHPQLDIMNNLPENSFHKVLNEFSAKSYHASFTAEKIKLYKKTESGSYQLAYAFSLPENSRYS